MTAESVASLRKNVWGLRRLRRPEPGGKPIPERFLTCAHYKPWAGWNGEDIDGKKQTGSCLLLGGAVHEWMVCDKFREE